MESRDSLANCHAELERSRRELEEFAYAASHDLREPLRKVVSFCQLLDETQRDRLDDEGREFLSYIVDGAERMKLLLHGLLELSRVGSHAEDMERVSLDAACYEALEFLSSQILDRGAIVHIEDLPEVVADGRQMTQLLEHLVGNAITFCEERDPEVWISSESGSSQVILRVRDNGIGIEKHELERIFGPFQRLHSRERFPGGGMGLAICRKIAERHGGSISAESEPDLGSTFTVVLPRE